MRSFIITLFLSVIVLGCKKRESAPVDTALTYTPAGTNITKDLSKATLAELTSAINGRWVLLSSNGGFTGNDYKTYTGVYYSFDTGAYTIDDNGKKTTITYNWKYTKSIFTGDSCYMTGSSLVFTNIVKDTLHAVENHVEPYSYSWLKVK